MSQKPARYSNPWEFLVVWQALYDTARLVVVAHDEGVEGEAPVEALRAAIKAVDDFPTRTSQDSD